MGCDLGILLFSNASGSVLSEAATVDARQTTPPMLGQPEKPGLGGLRPRARPHGH